MKPRPVNLLPELKPLVGMVFKDKLALTEVIIERNLREMGERCAATLSGGKDSTLVTALVIRRFPQIPVVFNNTGVEHPETIRFVREVSALWNLNLIETKPEKTFWDCVELWGWPRPKHSLVAAGKNTGKCCYWLKEKPMKLALRHLGLVGYFTGVTAVENRTRMFNARDKGTCYVTEGIKKVHPILYWTPDEVKAYSLEQGIPLNPIYAKGADRCGCSTCTAFIDWEQQLSTVNPKLYRMVRIRKILSESDE